MSNFLLKLLVFIQGTAGEHTKTFPKFQETSWKKSATMSDDLDLACKSGSMVDKYCSPDSPIMTVGRSFLRLVFTFFRSKPPAAPPSRFLFSFPTFSSGINDSYCVTLALASSFVIFVLVSYILRNKRFAIQSSHSLLPNVILAGFQTYKKILRPSFSLMNQ